MVSQDIHLYSWRIINKRSLEPVPLSVVLVLREVWYPDCKYVKCLIAAELGEFMAYNHLIISWIHYINTSST